MNDRTVTAFTPGQERFATRLMRRMSRIQAWVFRKSGGRLMKTFFFMAPVGILTSRGRRSGVLREACLVYGEVDGKIVLIASRAGCSGHPAWYHNLKASPDCRMQTGRQVVEMIAREAGGEEKAQLWAEMLKIYKGFDAYQQRADAAAGREIPLMVLERA